ncbi:hypothetical protein GCM10018952_00390 [Streptosporangium vulgare]
MVVPPVRAGPVGWSMVTSVPRSAEIAGAVYERAEMRAARGWRIVVARRKQPVWELQGVLLHVRIPTGTGIS